MQNEDKLAQKVALITGAPRRIGKEIAKTLHAAGANIVIHYRTLQEDAEKLCTELNTERPNSAVLLQADLLQMEYYPQIIQQSADFFGRLDILVNNASRFYRTSLPNTTPFEWDDLMNSNLKAPYFLSQTAIPYLEKHQGCIVNIADIHGERPMRDYSTYCITKAGLIMLTKAFAKELGQCVRVNAVSPGEILWPENHNALNETTKEKILSRIPMRKIGDAVAVAKAVLYLVRDADYVTGHILNVDGGRSLKI